MNLKDLIFGGGVKSGDDGGTYRDSIQAWLPIKNIIGGVVITKDGRFVKILELLPVNIYLKSPNDRQNIISSFAAYLKIAPNDLQMVARTLPADMPQKRDASTAGRRAHVSSFGKTAFFLWMDVAWPVIRSRVRFFRPPVCYGAMRSHI